MKRVIGITLVLGLAVAPPAAAASVDYGPISHKGLRSAGAASPGLATGLGSPRADQIAAELG